MTTNTKYENQSQQLYINSEGGFGGLGDQLDKFRVDLNTSPFSNTDDTILRASVTQFNMVKNFYNVNASNNAIRVSWEAYTSPGSIVVNDLDKIVKIPEGNYTTHDQLIIAFSNAVALVLNGAIQGGGTTFAVDDTETEAPNTHRNYPLASRDDSAGRLYEQELADPLWFRGRFTASNTAFRFNNLPVFQCLSVATNAELTLRDAGGDAVIPAIDFYNDSYILLGARRLEVFEDIATAHPVLQSFSVVAAEHRVLVENWFPMNDALNTTPYIYLRSRNSRTQASSNLEEGNNPHNHSMINSSLFAKIPRIIARDGSVSFILENSPYFTNITAQQLNSIELELTDAKGRPLPSSTTLNTPASDTIVALPTGVTQKKDGNAFCDMVLLIEKYQFNNPNSLTGFGFNPPQLNPAQFSTNPMMSVDNDGFR